MTLKRMQNLNVTGKRVLLRLDLNVPFDEHGGVSETTRLDRVKPTIDWLRAQDAKIIIMAHLGRPKGVDATLSLQQIVDACAKAWGTGVKFAGPDSAGAIAAMKDGDVLLLENIRFDPREEKNDSAFAKELAALGDIYINDAFSVSHRAHASTEGLAHLLPAAAGLSLQAEIDALTASVETPKRPVVGVIGGSKVSTKLAVLEHLVTKLDALIIGGGMANTFLLAQGKNIGDSLAEADLIDTAKTILQNAEKAGCRIVLPSDVVATLSLDAPTDIYRGPLDGLPEGYKIVDMGEASVKEAEAVIGNTATVIWNGPAGVFEKPPFDAGTVALARAMAKGFKERDLIAVAGGGDTLAAVEQAGLSDDDFTYLSTAGGAFLEWLEGKELPGVAILHTGRA